MSSMKSNPVEVLNPPINAPFPFLDLKAQFADIREEVFDAVRQVLDSQVFILGPELKALEQELQHYLSAPFAIGCASGSDAILLALAALEVAPGDEIITPPFTFVATAGSIARLGARPVFVDIEANTYNIDAAKIEEAITPKTRGIMPVHLFGMAADMTRILEIAKKHNLYVIEDAAQAIGAHIQGRAVGTLGNVGCFSFFPSKNLGGAGDGGLVTTTDSQLADRLRVLRVHGSRSKYQYDLLGMNSRLDALQAAILRVKLRHLDGWTRKRRANAERYQQLFREYGLEGRIVLPGVPADRDHVFNQYVIRTERRDSLRKHLTGRNIPTEIYYPSPLHVQPAFAYLKKKIGDFPIAEAASQQVLALPIYSELTESQQLSVVESIAEFFETER